MSTINQDPLRPKIYQSIDEKGTQELLEIWRTGKREKWKGTAFDIVEEILLRRLGKLPDSSQQIARTPGPGRWFQVWIKAVSHPNEQTFIDISESSDAQPKIAYIWVFIAGTLTYLISAVVQVIVVAMGYGTDIYGVGSFIESSLLIFICLSPVIGAIVVLFFSLGTAIIQWVARLFGGTGTYDKLVYTVAAIYMPISLVTMLLLPFNAIPVLNIGTGLLSIGVSFYYLFLQITAVKAVNRFGWGKAAGSVLLPGLVVSFVCACIVIGGLMLMGPIIGNVFSTINQSLQGVP